MALAYGGHAMFGLGFLNLIGTLLFFGFLVFAFKMFFRGMRYSKANGAPGPWNWGPSHAHRHHDHEDEAMKLAKERLAQSDISPEDFETLKSGLKASAPQPGYRQDSALATARMRFAQGELSQEEFDAVKKALLD